MSNLKCRLPSSSSNVWDRHTSLRAAGFPAAFPFFQTMRCWLNLIMLHHISGSRGTLSSALGFARLIKASVGGGALLVCALSQNGSYKTLKRLLVPLALIALPSLGRAERPTFTYATWYTGSAPMANGHRFNRNDATIAATYCDLYPLGSAVQVTNLTNNRSSVFVLQDRMACPSRSGVSLHLRRVRRATHQSHLDLSPAAAAAIGFDLRQGIIPVRITLMSRP